MNKTGPAALVEGAPRTSGRFAAVDFETADYKRDSACALSIVLVEGKRIVDRSYHLIRPPRRDFVFTYLHGISWDDVRDKPAFADVWDSVKHMIRGTDFIAAHNAAFDRSVLNACCTAMGRETVAHDFLCTVKLSRAVWKIFPTTLADVCRRLAIPLKHHDAASDALACARIVMAARNEGKTLESFLPRPKRPAKTRAAKKPDMPAEVPATRRRRAAADR